MYVPDYVPFGVYRHRQYCTKCKTWKDVLRHAECSKEVKGVIVFDFTRSNEDAELAPSCDSCDARWEIDHNIFYCSCGHAQLVEYRTEPTLLLDTDRVLAEYGDIIEYETEEEVYVIAKHIPF